MMGPETASRWETRHTFRRSVGIKQGATIDDMQSSFTNYVQHVVQLVQSHPFVQQVTHCKEKVLYMTLYIVEQMKNLCQSCCTGPLYIYKSSVICVDKTFNLWHVTVTVFKQLAGTRKDICDHPIFLGPM